MSSGTMNQTEVRPIKIVETQEPAMWRGSRAHGFAANAKWAQGKIAIEGGFAREARPSDAVVNPAVIALQLSSIFR